MKPEAGDYLAKARRLLKEAVMVLDFGLSEVAGRTAYMAAFHAAQALIFEREERSMKTHNGVHAAFSQLAKGDAALPREIRAILPQLYDMKAIADYGIGPGADVSRAEAAEAVAKATRFVAALEAALARPAP